MKKISIFSSELYTNDIALFRLTHPLSFTSLYIQPARIAKKSTYLTKKMVVAGWGETSESDVLQKAAVTFRQDSVCENSYEHTVLEYHGGVQICVGAGARDKGILAAPFTPERPRLTIGSLESCHTVRQRT